MNKKKVFLLSNDIYLFSGLRAFFSNLVLVDSQTFVSDSDLSFKKYKACLLIIDNRIPFFMTKKWLQHNSGQFTRVNCFVLRMSESRCINRGYETSASIDATLHYATIVDILKRILMSSSQRDAHAKLDALESFALTGFEAEMLNSVMTKEGQAEFCQANSLTAKSLYRYRDKITNRLGFDNFTESIIFLIRNRLLAEKNVSQNCSLTRKSADDNYGNNDAVRLSLALKNNEIVPYYQPVVGNDGELYGIEIMARWPSGHHYTISQREFIPLAESSGMINELTSSLMQKVASDLKQNNTGITKPLFVAFNVSPTTLSNPVFYWECLNFLDLTESLPVKLMIEITENQMLAVTPAIKELIRSLRNRGVMFALDDFGTGYANLCYLNELELDVIKIDKTFINAIQADKQTLPMLESIIKLAMILGLRTIAEGVEYDYQREWLIDKQVDYLQGYHFLPPVPFSDFRRFVEQGQLAAAGLHGTKKAVLPAKKEDARFNAL
ncbi:EAL domain-containing protein [Enterobacter asburiae]